MSCRETAAGSAITSWVRFANGANAREAATLAVFHRLRRVHMTREPERQRLYSEARYRDYLRGVRAQAQADTSLTERRRASILERLDAALAAPVPDAATTYALMNVRDAMNGRAGAERSFIATIATQTGQDRAAVAARMNELAGQVTSRSSNAPRPEDVERVAAMGLARDAGTVHAVLRLESEARHVQAAAARLAPQRVRRAEVPEADGRTGDPGVRVLEAGYDPRNGRYEVVVDAGGQRTTHAYRDVPAEIGSRSDHGTAWFDAVRGNPDFQYADEDVAAIDGAAPRCQACGQYADSAHSCPQRTLPRRMSQYDYTSGRWTRQAFRQHWVDDQGIPSSRDIGVRLPPIRRLQQTVNEGPAEIAVSEYVSMMSEDGLSGSSGRVDGTFVVSRADRRAPVEVDVSGARCSCAQYRDTGRCPHVDVFAQALRDRVERPGPAVREERDAAARAAALAAAADRVEQARIAALATDWMRDPATASEAAASWRRDADVLYSEDEAAFRADVEAALARSAAKNGAPDIPYMMENVLDGWCRRGSGQAIGLEIEYQFPSGWTAAQRAAANQAIGRSLYAAGLTPTPHQQPYRQSQRQGFRDTHVDANGLGTWSFEHDGSVDGELVAPAMYDERETWEKIDLALGILRENGAQAGVRAGAHVHVGTGGYAGSPAAYTELARMVTQHEDVLVRLGSDPARGTHRNNGYSRPLPRVPDTGFSGVAEVRDWQNNGRNGGPGRYATVNFANCRGTSGDHPEFRVFDSTLDPGAVQAQMKLAVAMTVAAQRSAAAGGTTRGKEEWGAHVKRAGLAGQPAGGSVSIDDLVAESGTTRSLLDALFRRREDKAQLAAVFAHTRWSTPAGQR